MKTIRALHALLALAVVAAGGAVADVQFETVNVKPPPIIPVEDFVRHAAYGSAKISPTGKYLAISFERADIDVLGVMETKTLKIIHVAQLPEKRSVGAFYWAGPERLMFTATRKQGRFASPFGTGEWYAVNADGSKARTLISYESGGMGRLGVKPASYSESFGMLDPLPEDDSKVLMQISRRVSSDGSRTEVVEVDTLSARRKPVARAPRENCEITLDPEQRPRFATCYDDENAQGQYEEHSALWGRPIDGEWKLLSQSRDTGRRILVQGFSGDGKTVYALSDDRKAPAAFGTLDPATGAFTEVLRDPVAEPSDFIYATDRETIVAVVTEAARPAVSMLDTDSPDAALYESLAAAFPGQFVDFSSATLDGKQIIVSVRSDRNPGELYLFDRDKGQARFLMKARQWLDAKKMAEVRPFKMKARDGLEMYGYLTIPQGVDLKNLPMIVNPHGGPIGPRDNWGFGMDTQMFANRGYLVLQLNFRGSGGYGQAFQDKGHRQWGKAMQDDLTDATHWAIKQGYADPKRICIYGGSYGGYASLMGAAKEPDLYKCAVGYVGVYDMPMMYKEGDIPERESGRRFLERTLGKDRQALLDASPTHLVDRIKIPVFLAAGARDFRAPPEQTEAMRDALVKAGNPPVETIIQPGEMHGFYEEEANLNLYTKILAFFEKHIGAR
jgi:dipeptidyl aminopeptidase/acylaminoacyl peptidase